MLKLIVESLLLSQFESAKPVITGWCVIVRMKANSDRLYKAVPKGEIQLSVLDTVIQITAAPLLTEVRLPQIAKGIPHHTYHTSGDQQSRTAYLSPCCPAPAVATRGRCFTLHNFASVFHLQTSYRITAFLKPENKTEAHQSAVKDDVIIIMDNILSTQKHTCFPEFAYKNKKKQQSVKVIVGLVAERTVRKLRCLTDFLKQHSCGKTQKRRKEKPDMKSVHSLDQYSATWFKYC